MTEELTIREKIAEYNDDAILWDGYDDAIIGYCTRNGIAIYDEGKMIDIAVKELNGHLHPNQNARKVAIEFLEYNVWSAYVGDFTPIHVFLFNKKYKDA